MVQWRERQGSLVYQEGLHCREEEWGTTIVLCTMQNKELTPVWYKDIHIVTQTATYTTHTYYSKCIVHCCHPSCVGGSSGVVATVTPLDRGDGEERSINSDGGARSDRRPVLPESDDLIWVTRNRSAVEDKRVA